MTLRNTRTHSRNPSTATNANRHSQSRAHSRAPSVTRPSNPRGRSSTQQSHARRASISSETESIAAMSEAAPSVASLSIQPSLSGASGPASSEMPLTPAASVGSFAGWSFGTAGASGAKEGVFLPPKDPEPQALTAATSRRSSISGISNAGGTYGPAPSSPASFRFGGGSERDRSTYGRSPSPMPPLPAIRSANNATAAWLKLYGDENMISFFRRLTFSPDGSLLFTPAGHFEDSSITFGPSGAVSKVEGSDSKSKEDLDKESSCVYVYSKANFSKAPIAALPGHKRACVCVKFSNVLYDLRPGIGNGATEEKEPITVELEPGKEEVVVVDALGERPSQAPLERKESAETYYSTSTDSAKGALGLGGMTGPTPPATPGPNPIVPSTPNSTSATGTLPPSTASVFSLPYRMLYAVASQDTVAIHDTQQATPICLLSKLHYDSFTDMAW